MTELIALEDCYEWYNEKINSYVSKPRSKAKSRIEDIEEKIEDVLETAKRFDYSDKKDPSVYENYATTIYEKTVKKFEDLKRPENITYNTLDRYYDDCNNTINSYIDVLSKYLSWLKRDRSFKNRVKSLDRALGKLRKEVYNFNTDTLVNYSEYKKYEDVAINIKRLSELIERKKELIKQINSHSDKIEKFNQMIEEKEENLNELVEHPGFNQLEENERKLNAIKLALTDEISDIKKLANKVLKAEDNNNIELEYYDRDVYKSLIKEPLEYLISQPEGYNSLKLALNNLKKFSEDPTVQLKKDKLERAFESIDEILEDSLLEWQKDSQFITKQSKAINDKFEEMNIHRQIQQLKEKIRNLKIDRDRLTIIERRELNEVEEEIKELNASIEEQTAKLLDIEIELQF